MTTRRTYSPVAAAIRLALPLSFLVVGLVVAQSTPPEQSPALDGAPDVAESLAVAAIRQASGATCLVFSTTTLSIVPASLDERIAALTDRAGWVEEGVIWLGDIDGLAAARSTCGRAGA